MCVLLIFVAIAVNDLTQCAARSTFVVMLDVQDMLYAEILSLKVEGFSVIHERLPNL